MCRRAVCPTCRKATYEGCGRHVEQVLAGVPAPQRCMCGPAEHGRARDRSGRPGISPGRSEGGWWTRLVDWMRKAA